MKTNKTVVILAALVFLAAGSAFAQIPYATGVFGNSMTGTSTNQKNYSGGRFGTDIDNYMDTKGWAGIQFDKHFFFLGGTYKVKAQPVLGYATRFGDNYLGLYYRGTVLQGVDLSHNLHDTNWDKDGNGSSKFFLNNNFAAVFGVPGLGGFRFDWVASDAANAAGIPFEKFKDDSRNYGGNAIDHAEGETSGSMSFLLSYGNTFLGKIKADATLGYGTPDIINVTGGQVVSDPITYRETSAHKVYAKVGGGYSLAGSSSVDADYSMIFISGKVIEQNLAGVNTNENHEGSFNHAINVNYSKSFNWDDKLTMSFKPNISFNILANQDKYTTQSTSFDNGRETIFTVVPSIAFGLRFTPIEKLVLYTGATIKLFDIQTKAGEKGADGATYGDGTSGSDIIEGEISAMGLGAAYQLTETLNIDFDLTQVLDGIFQNARTPTIQIYLTFKK